jgi:hypothetical protein
MKHGELPDFPSHPQLVRPVAQSLEEESRKSGKWNLWQFRLIIAGAVFYIAWHVGQMYLRTP